MTEEEKWKERFMRERESRKEAERLLEEKSRELFRINEQLAGFNNTLEEKVHEKTIQLEDLNHSLEKKVQLSIKKIRNQDELIIKQSRQLAMGEMIEMLSHQWRQPITGIGMSVNNMVLDIDMGEMDGEKFKKKLDVISDQVHYLSKTIDDFRTMFKQTGKKEEVLLHEVLQSALNMVQQNLESKNIRYKTVFQDETPLPMFKNEMVQVVLNILKNAIDIFVERKTENPRLLLRTVEKDGAYKVVIMDNAGGIPEKILPKIFDPYYSTKKSQIGTGIGLYMCKSIVENHMRGKMTAHNSEQGAVFEIVLQGKDLKS